MGWGGYASHAGTIDPPEEYYPIPKKAFSPKPRSTSASGSRHYQEELIASQCNYTMEQASRPPSMSREEFPSQYYLNYLTNANQEYDHISIQAEASPNEDATILSLQSGGGASVRSHRSHVSTREDFYSLMDALKAKNRKLHGIKYSPSSTLTSATPPPTPPPPPILSLSYNASSSTYNTSPPSYLPSSIVPSSLYSHTSATSKKLGSKHYDDSSFFMADYSSVPMHTSPSVLPVNKYSQKSTDTSVMLNKLGSKHNDKSLSFVFDNNNMSHAAPALILSGKYSQKSEGNYSHKSDEIIDSRLEFL